MNGRDVGALDGKVAIITGSGHGLGREHALLFAREGASGIVVNDIGTGESAAETVALVEELGGRAIAAIGDCSDWMFAHRMVASAVEEFGHLDILVNNAGIIRDRLIFNMDAADFDDVIRVNLRGTFCPTRHACTYWREQAKNGQPVNGRLITTTSAAGLWGNPGQPNYGAAKAGVVGMTLAVAHSMSRYGVTANVVAPSAVTHTDIEVAGLSNGGGALVMRADQVSPLVAYLATDKAAGITGQIFHAAGGHMDRVDGYRLIPGVHKCDVPWTVAELGAVFDQKVAGVTEGPMQVVLGPLLEQLMTGA